MLADDAERAQLVAEAREHVLRFDWAEVARQTLGLYRSELRAARRARAWPAPDPARAGAPLRCAV